MVPGGSYVVQFFETGNNKLGWNSRGVEDAEPTRLGHQNYHADTAGAGLPPGSEAEGAAEAKHRREIFAGIQRRIDE